MSCKWDREAEEYLVDGEPCRRDEYGDPTVHCTARRTCSNHIGSGELTCARCLNRTRTDVRQIVNLAALMLPTALATGSVDSEAANLAGPAADVEAWSWRKVAAMQGLTWHLSLVEEDDEHHPYTVLTRWQMMLSEDYGQPLPERLTVGTAADYLERNLHRIAQDDGQDFPLLARELRKCRSHLESVIRDSRAPERGAPCPQCADDGITPAPRLVREYGHWCDDPDCEQQYHYATLTDPDTGDDVPDMGGDRWACPRNKAHWWSEFDYRRWVEERVKARA